MRATRGWLATTGALVAALTCTALHAQLPTTVPDQETAAMPGDVPAEAAAPETDGVGPDASQADTDLASYVTGMVEGVRAREAIAGVIVSVVKDGRIVLSSGYGDAVVSPRRDADGDTTLFRIGSISKTFTYTAAMQLVERGLITLDDPVNTHLPEAIRIPDDGYAEPVLVRHLLTHTAGFEDIVLGHLFVRDPALEMPLDSYLAEHRPRRVRPPGAVAVYSNYSVALLGALIAHVSGMPFEDYIDQHLTGPLAMTRTTFREPLLESDPRRIDPNLAADIASGYRRDAGAFEKGEFEYIAHGAPAGGMSATAKDMARWMLMHLNAGELDGARILSSDTALRMRDVLFRNADNIPGIAHGFLTEHYGPYFAYGHGGATLYFHSGMVLVPDLSLGVFVSANTASARAAVRDMVRLIVEHMAPEARQPPATVEMSPQQLQRFTGEYRSTRRPYRTAEKAVLTLGSDTRITSAPDGSLRVFSGGDPLRMLPIGPMTFQNADGDNRMQFFADTSGQISGYTYGFGIATLERVQPLESATVLYLLLAVAGLISLVRLVRGWRQGDRRHPPRPGLFPVKALSLFSAATWAAFVGTCIVTVASFARMGNALVYAYPTPLFMWALALATLAALLTAVEVLAIVPVLRSEWRAWPKLRYIIAVALLALTAYVLWTWNLIGMKV